MTHVLSMFDSEWLHHYDLTKPEVVVTIESVKVGELKNEKGTKKAPVVRFKGAEKALALNKTNARAIIAMYGTDVEQWIGKRVTLYKSTCDAFGQTVDCIRIRPKAPSSLQAVPDAG